MTFFSLYSALMANIPFGKGHNKDRYSGVPLPISSKKECGPLIPIFFSPFGPNMCSLGSILTFLKLFLCVEPEI